MSDLIPRLKNKMESLSPTDELWLNEKDRASLALQLAREGILTVKEFADMLGIKIEIRSYLPEGTAWLVVSRSHGSV